VCRFGWEEGAAGPGSMRKEWAGVPRVGVVVVAMVVELWRWRWMGGSEGAPGGEGKGRQTGGE
jgi:protein-S-isoprenylcysteine O-methyltransferase Ste14